jgi:L-rhamnose-proton symport protein (RhaT)
LPYSFWVGIVLILIAGVMASDCMLPLKFSQRWKWENTWLVFSLVSLVALPWALALIFVNHPFQTYGSLTASQFCGSHFVRRRVGHCASTLWSFD